MMTRLGRVLAVFVAVGVGFITLIDLFISQSDQEILGLGLLFNTLGTSIVSWASIIMAFALIVGFFNVMGVHYRRIRTRKPGAIYSGVLLISLIATLAVGFVGGPAAAGTQFIFEFILQPLESTLFALLAFFIATAAFRAFRVQSVETFFFVLFAIIVLLGQVPISIYLWSEFPVIKDWILAVPTLAGMRGILLGVALGTIATGLRILVGADRPYTD